MTRGVLLFVLVVAGCDHSGGGSPDARRPARGRLVITSEPAGAVVIEDGHARLGRTPLTLERDAMDRLDLQLVKEGYQNHRESRLVEEGQTEKLHVVLRPEQGTLIVTTGLVQGATILVDGEKRGETPMRVHVSAGRRHLVEVRKGGFVPFRVHLSVEVGEPRKVNATLVPAGKGRGPRGWLTVRSDVPAVVNVDGNPFGSTPVEKVPLPARRYRVTVARPGGGASKTLRVTIRPDRTRSIEVRLGQP